VEFVHRERALDKHNVTLLFLGEHVRQSAKNIATKLGMDYTMTHAYPVMDWKWVFGWL
jgi:hypothetical protein